MKKVEKESPTNKGRDPMAAEKRNGETSVRTASEAYYERNRHRVQRYYCANMECGGHLWEASQGMHCPHCDQVGLIAEFRGGRTGMVDHPELILGFLNDMGFLFCPQCAFRHDQEDRICHIVYADSEPFSSQRCDACGRPLKG